MKKLQLLTVLFIFSSIHLFAQKNTKLTTERLEFLEGSSVRAYLEHQLNGDLRINANYNATGETGNLYLQANDDIFFTTNAALTGISMGIFQNGNVSIGEISTAEADARVRIKQATGTATSNSGVKIVSNNEAHTGRLWVGEGNFLIQKGNNPDQLVLGDAGNVGVGGLPTDFNQPEARLNVKQSFGTSDSNSGLKILRSDDSHSGRLWMNAADFHLQKGTNDNQFILANSNNVSIGALPTSEARFNIRQKSGTPDSNSGLKILLSDDSESGRLWVDGEYFKIQKGGNDNQLVLDANGRVSIGDNIPDFTFDVHHNSTSGGTGIYDGNNGIQVRNNGANGRNWVLYVNNSDGDFGWYNSNSNTVKAEIDRVSGNWVPGSDKRIKKDIASLNTEKELDKILQLRSTTYQFKDSKNERKVYGLIAQEVAEIYPDLILKMGEDGQQLGISYTEFIPVLIAGMQEQQALLERKEARIEDLENRLAKIEATLHQNNSSNIKLENTSILEDRATLQQNQPNPFSDHTTIQYYIPETVQQAQLQFHDLNGKVLKVIELNQKGSGQIELETAALISGTYSYSLVLDGKIFETKRMVVKK